MEQKSALSTAAIYGIYLAAITVVCSLLTTSLELKGAVSILMWIVKFAGTNYLLYYFMKRYANDYNVSKYGKNYSFGFLVSVFSSIICACYAYFSLAILFPNQTQEAINIMQESMSQQPMTSEVESVMEKITSNLPQITLFGTLVYYIIYGAIASAIIANFSKKEETPFSNSEGLE